MYHGNNLGCLVFSLKCLITLHKSATKPACLDTLEAQSDCYLYSLKLVTVTTSFSRNHRGQNSLTVIYILFLFYSL